MHQRVFSKKSLSFIFTLIGLATIVACSNPASSGSNSSTNNAVSTTSLTLGTQSGTIIAGTGGSTTYTVATSNVSSGTAGIISWFTTSAGTTSESAPTGITAVVTAIVSNSATLTVTVSSTVVAGSYYFTLAEGSTVSSISYLKVSGTTATPTSSVSGTGIARTVTLATTTPGAIIYYTQDGSTPSTSSTVYSNPITVAGYFVTNTISAIAVSTGTSSTSASITVSITPSSPLSSSALVSTFAGSLVSGSTDATGTAARFNSPSSITSDGTNLYIADDVNNEIRKIVIATGVVTTLAGSTTHGHVDGTGTSARFWAPRAITTDGTNLYVADYDSMIRKIVISTGVVTTLAGSTTQGSVDGTGTSASFNSPCAIATDGTNLYVADNGNHEIRKVVISTGVVTTLAGSTTSGHSDGTATNASFSAPTGITTDGTNLYVSDNGNNEIRQIVIATGVVTTLAGSTTSWGNGNGTGSAAQFNLPAGLITDGTNLYVTEYTMNDVRKIVIATKVVTTLAGGVQNDSTDGTGTAACFYGPNDIATDGKYLFVTDSQNNEIREIQ